MTEMQWSFWSVVHGAQEQNASTVHFVPGRPPMVRPIEGDLRPLQENLAEVTPANLMRELSTLVEPERWDALERTGEGEVVVRLPGERPVKLSLYRSQGQWAAVAYL